MTLDYALREGFIDLRRKEKYGEFSYNMTPGNHTFICLNRMDGGNNIPVIIDLSTMKATLVTTDLTYKYGVEEKHVVPGYDAVAIPRLLDEKA
jgi:hypothetical protein